MLKDLPLTTTTSNKIKFLLEHVVERDSCINEYRLILTEARKYCKSVRTWISAVANPAGHAYIHANLTFPNIKMFVQITPKQIRISGSPSTSDYPCSFRSPFSKEKVEAVFIIFDYLKEKGVLADEWRKYKLLRKLVTKYSHSKVSKKQLYNTLELLFL